MGVGVKICGLTRPDDLRCASEHGAAMTGFVFFPPSPRSLDPARWRALAVHRDRSIPAVGVMVDPSDDWIAEVLDAAPLEWIQLHGQETPERVAEVGHRFGVDTIKAFGVREAADVARAGAYEAAAVMLLFDARSSGPVPGGNGLAFDWRLLAGRTGRAPWLLSGGLNEDNLAHAVRTTGAAMVDLSSSIESAPGIKDRDGMKRVLARAALLCASEDEVHDDA